MNSDLIHEQSSANKGRELAFLSSLFRASALLQRRNQTEEALLSTFINLIDDLNLLGLIGLLDQTDERLVIYLTGFSPEVDDGLEENNTDINEMITIPLSNSEELNRILKTGKSKYYQEAEALLSQTVFEIKQITQINLIKRFGQDPTICSPITINHDHAGILIISNPYLIESHISFIEAFASQIASALDNVRQCERISQTEAQYQVILDASPDAVFLESMQGLILNCNDTACKMFGFTKEEILKLSVNDLIAEELDITLADAASDLQRTSGGLFGHRENGTKFPVEVSLHHVTSDQEPQIVTYVRDITRRKEFEDSLLGMESVLRRQTEELSAIYDVSRNITASQDLTALLETIVEQATLLLNGTGGGFYLCDQDLKKVHCVVSHRAQKDFRGTTMNFGEGIAGRVAMSGQPMIIDDYRTWLGRAEIYETDKPFRSVISAPVIWQSEVSGVLHVLDDSGNRLFTQAELRTLTQLANQAAVAIENARLLEGERRRRQEAETLRDASGALVSTLDLQSVLDNILTHLSEVIPYNSATVFLQEGDLIIAKAARGLSTPEMVIGQHYPADNELFKQIRLSRQPLVLQDAQIHPDFECWGQTDQTHGWMGIPLIANEKVIGYLTCDHHQLGAYQHKDAAFAQAFANQATIAIENARLFEQVIIEQRHLRLLYDISREMNSSHQADEILQRAINLTSQALGGLVGQAYLYNPEEGSIQLSALYGKTFDNLPTPKNEFSLPIGKGLVGWVASHQKAIILDDVDSDARWEFISNIDDNVKSALSAPILVGKSLYGVLAVHHHKKNAFSDSHLRLLEAICQEVGLALSNAKRYQQIQQLSNILKTQQQQLENLVEHIPVGVLLLDSNRRILVMNPIGSQMVAILNGEEPRITQALRNIGPITLVELIDRKEDALPVEITLEEYPKRIYAIQMRSADNFKDIQDRHYVLTINDITVERENLARIQSQDRLATVGQLAAGIAHDFNNIMATILVYADLMSMDTTILPPSQEKLNVIKYQIQRASSLIRQILDFSRKSVMDQSTLDLLPLVKELEKILERTFPETIQLELVFESDHYWVNGDPTRLQQVFMNLALNARDAMPDGGTLRISLKKEHLPLHSHLGLQDIPPGDWIIISVTDSGVGIPPELEEHIFEPFFTTKPVDQGTGLGLAQVYGIVKQHDGYINFHSQSGDGTTFVLYLPELKIEADIVSPSETGPLLNGHGTNVLVVEDDPITREAIHALLIAYGFDVLLAANGSDALILLEDNHKVELVISDIVMPKMGGVELYQRMQELYPHIKVLLITGHPIEEESHTWLEKGEIHWLQKPFSTLDFKRTMVMLLQ